MIELAALRTQPNPIFWHAFLDGLAAPVGLFAPPEPCYSYLGSYSVALSFANVAAYLDYASGVYVDVGQPWAEPTTNTG